MIKFRAQSPQKNEPIVIKQTYFQLGEHDEDELRIPKERNKTNVKPQHKLTTYDSPFLETTDFSQHEFLVTNSFKMYNNTENSKILNMSHSN